MEGRISQQIQHISIIYTHRIIEFQIIYTNIFTKLLLVTFASQNLTPMPLTCCCNRQFVIVEATPFFAKLIAERIR